MYCFLEQHVPHSPLEAAQAISLVIDDMEKNKEEAMALVKSLTDKYPLYE